MAETDLFALTRSPNLEIISGNDCFTGGIPDGCGKTVECPEWPKGSEDTHYDFLTLNQINITSGILHHGTVQLSGQASGQRILCRSDVDGTNASGEHLGGADYIKNIYGVAAQDASIPDNLFTFKSHGIELDNGFVINFHFYPRFDPFATYANIYGKLNRGSNAQYYNSDLISKYSFVKGKHKTRYTWIPTFSKVTGLVGGYFWHVMKYIGEPGDLEHAYRDLGMGNDGIGRFLSFTGNAGSGSFKASDPVAYYSQDAAGHDYTGLGITGEPSTGYLWHRSDFETGNSASFLYDINNYTGLIDEIVAPPAPSLEVVETIVRYMERKAPDDWYKSGSLHSPCQDPHVARPSAVQIIHDNVFRGTSFSALFIESMDETKKAWDFDFLGFQSGDFVPGVHYGLTSLGPTLGSYDNAKKWGNIKNSFSGIFDSSKSDGFNPISHFYHHRYTSQAEIEKILTLSTSPGNMPKEYTLKNWYTTSTGQSLGSWNETMTAAPFSTSILGEIENNTKSRITYIPIESTIQDLGEHSFTPSRSRFMGLRPNNPHKACGHRFLSGIRLNGTILDPELRTELLPWTRSNKMSLFGGTTYGGVDVEAGEIYHPKFELWDPFVGSVYRFSVSGSGIFVFPQDDSKPVQFVTGASYSREVIQRIIPSTQKWFCPKEMDSLEAAGLSTTQSVFISGAVHPPVFSYRINLLEDFERAGPAPWDNGFLRFYDHDGNDMLDGLPSRLGFTGIELDGNTVFYDIDMGNFISTIEYEGNFTDGPNHTTRGLCQISASTPVELDKNILYWTTGYGGTHRSCCTPDVTTSVPYLDDFNFQCVENSGYAARPSNFGDMHDGHMTPLPVLSEYSRAGRGANIRCSHVHVVGHPSPFYEGMIGGIYPHWGSYGAGYRFVDDPDWGWVWKNTKLSTYTPHYHRKHIDFFMSHPNRGFVQFNCDQEDEGILYGKLLDIPWGGYDGCELGGNDDGFGNCDATYPATAHAFEQNRIVSEYEFSGLGHNFIQKFVIPRKEVWIEHTGDRKECNTYTSQSTMACPVNTFNEVLEGELRHVYIVNKVWCPVVFHKSVGDLYTMLGQEAVERAYDNTNVAYWCPAHQMPFPDDERCEQNWPVIVEWSQLDQFVGDQGALEASVGCGDYENILPKHPLSPGGPPAPDGTFRDTLQNLWNEGIGEGMGYPDLVNASPAFCNDGTFMKAGTGNWNGTAMGMLLDWSAMGINPLVGAPLPWKSGVYTETYKHRQDNFCLRLIPQTTFNVKVTDKRYTTDALGGSINGTPYFNEEILSTKEFKFQTNGAGGWVPTVDAYGSPYTIIRDFGEEWLAENMMTNSGCHFPQVLRNSRDQAGHMVSDPPCDQMIHYQKLLDANKCTFNVRKQSELQRGNTTYSGEEGPNGYILTENNPCEMTRPAQSGALIPYWSLDVEPYLLADDLAGRYGGGNFECAGHSLFKRNLTRLMKEKSFYTGYFNLLKGEGNPFHPYADPVNRISGLPDIGSLNGLGAALTTGHVESAFTFTSGEVEAWTTLLANGALGRDTGQWSMGVEDWRVSNLNLDL